MEICVSLSHMHTLYLRVRGFNIRAVKPFVVHRRLTVGVGERVQTEYLENCNHRLYSRWLYKFTVTPQDTLTIHFYLDKILSSVEGGYIRFNIRDIPEDKLIEDWFVMETAKGVPLRIKLQLHINTQGRDPFSVEKVEWCGDTPMTERQYRECMPLKGAHVRETHSEYTRI